MSPFISDAALLRRARIAGALSLLTILGGLFAQGYVYGGLMADDAGVTAANLLAHKTLYQAGFAVFLMEMAAQVAATALYYFLLKPVDEGVATVSAFLSLVGCAVKTTGRLFFIAPLFVLAGAHPLAFSAEESHSLVMLLFRLTDRAAEMGLFFFGLYAILNGYLIFRSTFLPRILGVPGMIAGVGWLTFMYPPLAYRLFPIIVGIALIGSLALIGWLLVKGVDVRRWKAVAGVES